MSYEKGILDSLNTSRIMNVELRKPRTMLNFNIKCLRGSHMTCYMSEVYWCNFRLTAEKVSVLLQQFSFDQKDS
jgi:hypothetical protein